MRLELPEDCCRVAREMIAHGLPRAEVLEFYRGDVLCLKGTAGAFADAMVSETAMGPRHVRYQAFDLAAKTRLGRVPIARKRRPARIIVQE